MNARMLSTRVMDLRVIRRASVPYTDLRLLLVYGDGEIIVKRAMGSGLWLLS